MFKLEECIRPVLPLLIPLCLQSEQARVLPILGKQTLVIALFQYLAVVDDNDSVCCAHR